MFKHLILPLFFCAAIIFLVALQVSDITGKEPIADKYMRTMQGDNLAWKDPGYNDSHWNRLFPVKHDGNWWLRMPVNTKQITGHEYPLGMMIELQGSYELYVNGHLVGRNGTIGTGETTEVPGKRIGWFLIDSSIMEPQSVISLRISSFHDKVRRHVPRITVGPYFNLARSGLTFSTFILVLAGIFLIVMIYYLFLYFISFRYTHFLLFGMLCFLFLVMLVLEYSKFYFLYAYPLQYYRLEAISIINILISLALCLFLFYRFALKNTWYSISILLVSLLVIWILVDVYDHKNQTLSITGLGFAGIITSYAVYKRLSGAWEILFGIMACLTCYYYYDITLYAGFAILVISMLVSLSRQIKDEKRIKEETLRYANRIELELLKNAIQPHFLVNSLAVLSEFIASQPQKSLPFISALTELFDNLCEISALQLVTVEKEITLCQAYLKIMSYRKDRTYHLQLNGVDLYQSIPPAIFLSVIENGIMHNYFEEQVIVFTIDYAYEVSTKRYIIYSPGKNKLGDIKEGTGLQYIKARLEESFPGKHTLISVPATGGGWHTEIIIKNT
jgi:hypothetical protein